MLNYQIKDNLQFNSKEIYFNEKIDISNLDNIVMDCYGSDWSAKLRKILKERGVKNVSVKNQRGGWTTSIAVTIKFTNDDFRSVEEVIARDGCKLFYKDLFNGRVVYVDGTYYNQKQLEENLELKEEVIKKYYINLIKRSMKHGTEYCVREPERNKYPELTDKAFGKLVNIYKIASAARRTESDPYTDYYYTNYYLDIYFSNKDGAEVREYMTEDERQKLEDDQKKKNSKEPRT